MSSNSDDDNEPALVTHRTMDIAVALLFLLASAIVILDSTRLGTAWKENEGPAAGYFPFYIALLMAFASSINLIRAALGVEKGGERTFVTKPAFGRVLAVLVPAIVYVALIQLLGIYVASAIFIAAFMLYFGKEPIWKALAVGVGVPLALFVMFEIWFLVPLPKGPVEKLLGF